MKKTRKSYTAQDKESALRYYLIGLNLHEVSKLTDVNFETLTKWQKKYSWTSQKEPENIKTKAYEFYKAGKSYDEICKTLKKSKATIWRYIKEIENLK